MPSCEEAEQGDLDWPDRDLPCRPAGDLGGLLGGTWGCWVHVETIWTPTWPVELCESRYTAAGISIRDE